MEAVQPAYLQVKNFKNLEKQPNGMNGDNGRVFENAPKWYIGETTPSIAPGFKWYRSSTIPKDNAQSVDHVYEKQLIELFLKSQIGTPDFSCDDMKILFFPCGQNKMQPIFDQLPGMQMSTTPNRTKNLNIGFAGLDLEINYVKGVMFDKGIDPPSGFFKNRLRKSTKLKTIQDFFMLFEIMKDHDFQKMFDVTNNRVYQAFYRLDKLISNRKDINGQALPDLQRADGTPMPANWALKYKTWMKNYLNDISGPVWTWANTTCATRQRQLRLNTTIRSAADQKELAQLSYISGHANFTQSFFRVEFGLTWQTGSNLEHPFGIHGSCSPNASSLSFASTGSSFTTKSLSASLSTFSGTSTWETVTTSAAASTPSFSAVSSATLPSSSEASSVLSSTVSSPPTTFVTSSSNPTSMSRASIGTTLVSTPGSDSAESTTTPNPTPATIELPVTTDPVDYFADPAIAMATTPAPEEDGPEVEPLPESIDAGGPF